VKPLDEMRARVEVASHDSSTAEFMELMYFGELMLKLSVLGLLAALHEDRDRHRYRLEYGLVRADGIGDWKSAAEDVLLGPASQHLRVAARPDRNEFTQRFPIAEGNWQVESVRNLNRACRVIDSNYEEHPVKVSLVHWMQDFVWLRNKTRAHGAIKPAKCEACTPLLHQSLNLLCDNLGLFQRSWALLRQNLSGKFRVIPIGGSCEEFQYLKKKAGAALADGIHVYFESPAEVHLFETDLDLSDFFVANGSFKVGTFEALSYKSDERRRVSAAQFVAPPTALPPSETEGLPGLDVQGNVYGNIPPPIPDYVERSALEKELAEVLLDDRHPVVTLVGRGGIGKTSLALKVLHDIAELDRYTGILWFSARDIDLRAEGPKIVRPHVLSLDDIAEEFVELTRPLSLYEEGFSALEHMVRSLGSSPELGPLLCVFDNFETVRNPADLYQALDTYVRVPNKILITTRIREFKADYPVEVGGMTESEFDELVRATSARYGVTKLLSDDYLEQLYDESDGHPYVIKVFLGQLALAGMPRKLERVMASQDDILDALFDRTYESLAPAARRVFLTLCGWRSVVARFALEAALVRPANEVMDVHAAVDSLVRSSLVELSASPEGDEFISVPLAAEIFGRKKLAVSQLKRAIDSDLEILRFFGAAREADVSRGVTPRVDQLFANVGLRLTGGDVTLGDYLPVLQYVARRVKSAWLSLADLQLRHEDSPEAAADSVRRYLESNPTDREAWRKLASIYKRMGNRPEELDTLVQGAQQPGSDYDLISSTLSYVNFLYAEDRLVTSKEHFERVTADLVRLLDERLEEADALDCSRGAWAYVRLKRSSDAKRLTLEGLKRDPANDHCKNLARRLNIST
jgi:hypothetical protein